MQSLRWNTDILGRGLGAFLWRAEHCSAWVFNSSTHFPRSEIRNPRPQLHLTDQKITKSVQNGKQTVQNGKEMVKFSSLSGGARSPPAAFCWTTSSIIAYSGQID
jgi:hypothetical protein